MSKIKGKDSYQKEQWEKIANLSFHDLRHNFAHRARWASKTLKEVAYYLRKEVSHA